MALVIHHVEIGVQDGESALKKFISQYKFNLAATRKTAFCNQWLVQKGRARFLLTHLLHKTSDIASKSENDDYSVRWDKPDKSETKGIDSVFNVALEVKDVENCLNRVVNAGGSLVKPLRTISSPDGSIQLGVVRSCVGNVVHTIINSENFKGQFLPGFSTWVQPDSNEVIEGDGVDITHIDHVTFACTTNRSADVLQWYEKAFGMKRFLINRDEDETDGFVVEYGDLGVRLKAMEYWRCAEVGLTNGHTDSQNVTFVIAESLHKHTADQLNIFLSDHGGEGIQHIGLHTPDIFTTVAGLARNGVEFTEPPFTYYTEVGKLEEIETIGESVEELKTHGILLDRESDESSDNKQVRYLMQKFTKPLFSKRTFFLEVIQRVRATGFGAGNITALWQSVQAYLNATAAESKPEQSTS